MSPDTSKIPTAGIGQTIDAIVDMYSQQRKSFERRWYDNNFFDDGHHFRYLNRTTGKIVDLSDRGPTNLPQRAIPKASRQIRGVANLLISPQYTPVIYPEDVPRFGFTDEQQYQQAYAQAKLIAQKSGYFVTEEFSNQEILEKTILMLLLSAKHGVSYFKMWQDPVKEKINSKICDAFDIYLMGNLTELSDSPSIVEAAPELISVLKANEHFDEEQLTKISPDNKYASSEIKQAYMLSRFGTGTTSDSAATLILKEAFMKEYLSEDNVEEVKQYANDTGILDGKNMGDMVMRHVFSAGGVWLKDEYVDIPDYPYVDFRYEPGPMYQVPLIERFIPANKSLDIISSRVEAFSNTMVTGVYQVREGEDFKVTNTSGAQIIKYKGTPLTQMQPVSVPGFMFDFMGFLEKLIEEQGASTAALNQLPKGVKSGVAIESVKASEFANLQIASIQLKKTTRHIAEKILDISSNFIEPQTVYRLDKGEPDYFSVIGQRGLEKRQELGMSTQDMIPIKKDYRVRIEVESGLGFTMEGKKQTMQQIIDFMSKLAEQGLITQDALKVVVRKFLDIYQFGSTQEFMDALDSGTQASPLTEEQLNMIKIAMLETLKDADVIGDSADQKLVDSTKVGVVEALKDTGMINKPQEVKEPSQSISFKDLPPEGKAQMAAKAGIALDPSQIAQQEAQQAKGKSV